MAKERYRSGLERLGQSEGRGRARAGMSPGKAGMGSDWIGGSGRDGLGSYKFVCLWPKAPECGWSKG